MRNSFSGSAPHTDADAKEIPLLARMPRLLFHLDQLARHKRGVIAVLIVLLTITATALVQVHASARFLGITWTEKTRQMGTPQEPKAAQLSEDMHQRIELEQEAKTQLTREHEARVALEAQVGQLVSELAAQTRKQETAERASADTSAQLIAEQKARVDAEDATKASKEALSRIEPATPTAVALPLIQKTQGERKTIETLASWMRRRVWPMPRLTPQTTLTQLIPHCCKARSFSPR